MDEATTTTMTKTGPAQNPAETSRDGIQAARESFSGRTLTESQFQEAMAVAAILRAETEKTGSFLEKLTDHAHLFSRAEKFDALRGEKILRDIYQARYGETLNQTRETLLDAEKALPETARARALTCAETIGELIRKAPTQPFYMAYDRAAVSLARELKITQSGAKALMKETFEIAHGRDLYEVGKALEAEHHRPAVEAAAEARKAEKSRAPARAQSRS